MSVSLSGPLAAPFTLKGAPVHSPVYIAASVTQVATAANTTETDFVNFPLPPGLLDMDGRALRLTAFGTFGATANNKRLRAYLGATMIADSGNVAGNNVNWLVEAVVTRTGAAAQLWRNRIQHGAVLLALGFGTGTENLANGLALRLTGTNGTAAANDIVFRGARAELV